MALAPQPGAYVLVMHGSGSTNNYSSEAMEEVNLYSARWGFKPRYTVYRIADETKRMMMDTESPVIQKKVHGSGDWVTVSASAYKVWYGAGYVEFSSPLNSDDTVQCLSGKYLTADTLIGCIERSLTMSRKHEDCTCFGDESAERAGTVQDWNASLTALRAKKCAEATSSGGSSNSHVRVVHHVGGTAGNSITIDFQDNNSTSLSVSVVGTDIVVDLDTDLGIPISTAASVVEALNNNAAVAALGVRAEIPSGEDGSGIVADSGPYTLAGGADEIDFEELMDETVVLRFYNVADDGDAFVGLGRIESVGSTGGPADLMKADLSVVGARHPIYHVVE